MQLRTTDKSKKMKLSEASAYLEVSAATLRNWVRSGLVSANQSGAKLYFYEKEIQSLKEKLVQGTVSKLRKRANKKISNIKHGHAELLNNPAQEPAFIDLLESHAGDAKPLLLAIYLLQLQNANLDRLNSAHIQNEIKAWQIETDSKSFKKKTESVLNARLDLSDHLLSYAYQYLSDVGTKQKAGAYYTPAPLVQNLVQSVMIEAGSVLDPCCGGGNFLIESLKQLERLGANQPWQYIYGADHDGTAVLIARANLTLASGGQARSVEQIRHQDSLLSNDWGLQFKYVLTNPPWGAKFDKKQLTQLKLAFPQIKSGESFSYFVLTSMKCLSKGGVLGFILPDAFLNVKMHIDIRQHLIQNYKITNIRRSEEKFSGVFTQTFMLVVKNTQANGSASIQINNGKTVFNKSYKDIISDADCAISIESDIESEALLKLIEKQKHIVLKGFADWALGVVTGDNKKFLSNKSQRGFEPVYKGTEVLRFRLNKPSTYLLFAQNELQQVAPLKHYRHPEKLVYRFICKELVFAVDRSGLGTLNSANILIPQMPGYSTRALCGILNSVVAQFYYQKKFNTFKTLRSNLEKFPFPKADQVLLKKIEKSVIRLEKGYSEKEFKSLNELVMDLYKLPNGHRAQLRSFKLSASFDQLTINSKVK